MSNPSGNVPMPQQYLQQQRQQIAQNVQHARPQFQQPHPNASLQHAVSNPVHHPQQQLQNAASQFTRLPQGVQQQHVNFAMASQAQNPSIAMQYPSQQTQQHHALLASLTAPNLAVQQQQMSQVRGHMQPQVPLSVYNQQELMQYIQLRNPHVATMSPDAQQEYLALHLKKWKIENQLQKKPANQSALEQVASRNYNAAVEIEQKLSSLSLAQQQHRDPASLALDAQYQQMQMAYGQDQAVLHGQGYTNIQHVPGHNQDVAKRSTLSANAAEFVPRAGGGGSVPPNASSSGQNSAPMGHNYVQEGSSLISIQPEYACHPVVQQVDSAVVQLTGNPSKFESIVRHLTTILSWQVKEENLMKEVVTVIFEQGVGEANFRFSGGKLCEYLIKNVQQQYNGPSFKSILLKRCQEEYEHRQDYLSSKYYDRLIGFTYFLAEITVKLLMPTGQPIDKLKEALCNMLNILLDIASTDSLKCSAQVLKMSGRYLEMGSSSEIEELIMKLRDIAMSTIPPHIQSVLMSVVELRAANWGVQTPSEENGKGDGGNCTPDTKTVANNDSKCNNNHQPGSVEPVLGTVYYGPDGVVDHIEEDTVDEYQSDNEEARNQMPPICELDGEEGAAFDEFLQSMK